MRNVQHERLARLGNVVTLPKPIQDDDAAADDDDDAGNNGSVDGWGGMVNTGWLVG